MFCSIIQVAAVFWVLVALAARLADIGPHKDE